MKKINLILEGFVLAIMSLLLAPNEVYAKEAVTEWGQKYILIDSANELREEFKDKNATIEGTTITLTGNVVFEDSNDSSYKDVTLSGADYILNLNGYTLSLSSLSIIGGSLTINDETGEGKIDAFLDVKPENGTEPKLIINNGSFDAVSNYNGTLEINGGSFSEVWLDGTSIINGGVYTSYKRYDTEINPETQEPYWMPVSSHFNLYKDITINGGEFKKEGLEYAFYIYKFDGEKQLPIDKSEIESIVGESYEIDFEYCHHCEFNSEFEAYFTNAKITHPIFDKIIKNGVLTLNVETPDNADKAYFFLSEVVRNMSKTDKYNLEIAFPSEGDFDPQNGVISLHKLTGEPITARKVKVVYQKSDNSASAKVAPIV